MSHVILAAGGTGGHLFPAEATAAALLEKNHQVSLITDQRGGKFSSLNIPVHRIAAATLKQGWWQRLRAIASMGLGLWQARLLLQRLKPDVVIGYGGYPSVPTVYAAHTLGIPIILHEQNAVLGRANRALLDKAKLLATSF
ncbi:MAG: UDP-N-acetylglucosamine--N-acetylmuramyl-(pentapeptide) pyrophosphoryl-undecaprenol N-acetylglucosamine transferase, partial [Alphaproteobacteria bacterium]|nr:UDP-N-acetylglucosamine--N-acetylmuramyl-(pentapeptide) pyrophosphoryl-undecaprenol N-acetylglucosamine transferase [Alphaproteobacteria bacterium]